MFALARSQQTGPAAPVLTFTAQREGVLSDLAALQYRILDVSDDTKRLTPVEVVAWTAVNLVTERLTRGRYAPTWTVPSDAQTGEYEVRWRWKFSAPDAWTEAGQPFEVVAAGRTIAPYHCLLSDMRDEGVTTAMANDARVMLAIQRASVLAERLTGRAFGPTYKDVRRLGSGAPGLNIDEPIIGLEGVVLGETYPSADLVLDGFRIYARHLNGQLKPDDRDNPRVELRGVWSALDHYDVRVNAAMASTFPRSVNVILRGVFGYTEPDGTPMGGPSPVLRRAVQLLTFRDLDRIADVDAREDKTRRHRLVMERTRDQQYQLQPSSGGGGGAYTGDPEIDRLLAMLARPPFIGSV